MSEVEVLGSLSITGDSNVSPSRYSGIHVLNYRMAYTSSYVYLGASGNGDRCNPARGIVVSNYALISASTTVGVNARNINSFGGVVISGYAVDHSGENLSVRVESNNGIRGISCSGVIVRAHHFYPS